MLVSMLFKFCVLGDDPAKPAKHLRPRQAVKSPPTAWMSASFGLAVWACQLGAPPVEPDACGKGALVPGRKEVEKGY